MASTPQEKFDAAVKVIQSLPKEGPFQPSHEMMLMFYAYFKQATEGPCHRKKPNFWEIVAKAKWDAWNKLGDMDRDVAMLNYVDELKKEYKQEFIKETMTGLTIIKINNEKWKDMEKKRDPRIVEAMPQTNDVGAFMRTLGSFYEIVDEESPIETATVANHKAHGGSTGVTPEQSHSDTSSEHDKEDDLNFSLRVEQTLQQGLLGDEADAIREFPNTATTTTESLEVIQEQLIVNGERGEEEVEEEHEDEEDEEVEEEEEDEDTEKVVSNSESEEEFCDTSEVSPDVQEALQVPVEEKILALPHIQLQSSTPLKREAKQNHVRFATPTDSVQNGRVSPISDSNIVEYLHMPSGFPYLHSKIDGPLSDSLLVQTDGSCDITTASLIDRSCVNRTESDYSSNNSVLNPESPSGVNAGGGEENEPPGGGDGEDRRGQGQRSMEGQPSRSSQSSGRGVPTQGGLQRNVLLTGGGAGGGGEDNPPQGPTPHSDPVSDQIALILVRLQQDMNRVLERLNRLEEQTRQRQDSEKRTSVRWSWWPFTSPTGRTAFFVLVWPVIVHLVLSYLFRRRRRR